jgi:iron complex outermembrane receptor protein
MNRSCQPQAVAWAVALLCALMAAGGHAQTAAVHAPVSAPDGAAEASLPAVRITGTALRRIDAETAAPMIVLRRAEIERGGARTVTEVLQQLPLMQGMVQTTSVVGQDTRGYASVSLHDLGDAYTLVLLNGQRLAPFGGQLHNGALPGVDLNTLPLAMVERIEVMSDGASAVYGADALGGVVNIVTRRDGDANEATVGWSWPRGGAREWRASAYKGVGTLDEQGQSLSLGVSALHRSALQASARSYARDAIRTVQIRGQRYQFADVQLNAAPANVFDSGFYLLNPYRALSGACGAQALSADWYGLPVCAYNYTADLDLVPEQTQHSLMASYTRQFAPDSKLQLDALWSRSVVRSHLAPVSAGLSIPASSPLYAGLSGLGAVDDPTYAFYRFSDLGRRGFDDTSTAAHLAARLDGRWQGWSWQAGYVMSVSDYRGDIDHAMGQRAAQALVDADLIDPFVPPGQQPASGLAAMRQAAYNGHWLSGRSTLQELQWQASRALVSLPGGDLNWAWGASLRHERLSSQPSALAQGLDGELRQGDSVPILPTTASRTGWGVFTEVLAPLTTTLEWGGALRGDHDEVFGNAVTARTSARWRPSPRTMWRASLGTGFRAPTLNQLRTGLRSDATTQAAHACTDALMAQAVAVGATPCTLGAPDAYYGVLTGGNANLRPEQSIQASLGWRIEPLAGHSLGMDLWAVHIHDRIGVVNEGVAFEDAAAVPGVWARAPDGSLAFSTQPRNLGTLMSSGLDVDASVRRGSAIGLIDSQLRVSALLREDAQAYPGGPWQSNLGDGRYGDATLQWRATWRVSVSRSGWTHGLTARYQSGYHDSPVTLAVLDATGQPTGDTASLRLRVPGQWLWDWQTRWQPDAHWTLSLGVLNLLDARPPLSLNQIGATKAQILGYDERYADPRGRTWTLEARCSF